MSLIPDLLHSIMNQWASFDELVDLSFPKAILMDEKKITFISPLFLRPLHLPPGMSINQIFGSIRELFDFLVLQPQNCLFDSLRVWWSSHVVHFGVDDVAHLEFFFISKESFIEEK